MSKLLLEANQIVHYFADRKILDFERFVLYAGERVGIVGANGSGKTTLLNLLSGRISPDEGQIRRSAGISYLEQFGKPSEGSFTEQKKLGVLQAAGQEQVSGGEATRLRLAQAVGRDAPILFADEPTSNLDQEGTEQAAARLEQAETLVVVSHDRALLDRLCTRIIEVEDGKLNSYEGNFTAYRLQKEAERQRAGFEYTQYRKEKSRLEGAIEQSRRKAGSVAKAPPRMGKSEARLHKLVSAEITEKLEHSTRRLESRLERLEVKERPKEEIRISFDFSLTDPPENKVVLRGKRVSFSYGERKILNSADFVLPRGSRTALCGKNGAGKTTLLNRIAEGDPAIRPVPKAKIGYFRQSFEQLDFSKTVLENAMRHSVQPQAVMRNMLARLYFRGDAVFKPASVLSGGERIKLSFAKLFGSEANLLLLDEPTNYLDLPSIETLQELVCAYEGTILFVSHDQAFAEACATRLLFLEDGKLRAFEGSFAEYREAQNRPPEDAQKALRELRLAEVISRLSMNPSEKEKEALEAEFQRLLARRKE